MINWVKNNKLSAFLIFVILFFVYQFSKSFYGISPLSMSSKSVANDSVSPSMMGTGFGSSAGIALPKTMPSREYAPQAEVTNRLVIQESNLSLLVKDVVDTRNKILEHTTKNGGYMITASTSNPEDAPTATVSIRIPSDKLQTTLDFFHSLSIKVVSENLYGTDVTDQYVDLDKNIELLESTMVRYEDILAQATRITDITELTNQILYIQSQIDSYKGQKESLEKNAQLARLTVYLSTDEIALPYAPSETFRPAVIFKLAVRSLVSTLRGLAQLFIWIVVYSVIWIPALLIFIFVRRMLSKNTK